MTQSTCSKFIALMGWGFVLFGLFWVTTAFRGMDLPGRLLIDLLDWPLDGLPSTPSQEARWMGAIGAGLTVGIGMLLSFVCAPLLRLGGDTAQLVRRGIIISFSAWFIVDGIGSFTSGVPSNIVFNALFYLMVVVPLVMVKFEP